VGAAHKHSAPAALEPFGAHAKQRINRRGGAGAAPCDRATFTMRSVIALIVAESATLTERRYSIR